MIDISLVMEEDVKSQLLKISGMNCQHCVMSVREELESIDGLDIKDVQIGSAQVEYDEEKVDQTKIREAIDEAGFVLEN